LKARDWSAVLSTLGLTKVTDEAENLEKLPSWHARDDNTLMLEAFEWYVPHDGRHWHRLRRALPDLKEIGIDNLLLPPGCKAMHASGNGYDIYDLYDLGEFDQKGTVATKWGTRDDLQRLAETAHQMDMGLYWDAVLNHKAGADYTERFRAVTVEPQGRDDDHSVTKKAVLTNLDIQTATLSSPNRKRSKRGLASIFQVEETDTAR
jgi:alpha-amylase